MSEENPTPIILPEGIKLMKMSKGYQWEIKTHMKDNDLDSLDRLEKLNQEMQMRFGSTKEE